MEMFDQAEKLRQMMRDNTSKTERRSSAVIKQSQQATAAQPRVIAVTSGKGGVGKTSVTINLALAFAAMGKKVLVIDADLGTANVDVMLGCSTRLTIMHLLEEGYRLNDVLTEGPLGIRFLSGGSGIYQLANLSDLQLQQLIRQITLCDTWADLVLIDTGAGLNRTVLNFVKAADEVLLVTTPEPTAMTDAYALLKAYAGQNGTAPVKLVVNRVTETAEGQTVVDKLVNVTARFLGITVQHIGMIQEDRCVSRAIKSQKPLLLAFPEAESTRSIEQLARHLLTGDHKGKATGIKGFFTKILEMMR